MKRKLSILLISILLVIPLSIGLTPVLANGGTLLQYDDGTVEGIVSMPAGWMAAVYFTPPYTPAKITELHCWFLNPSVNDLKVNIFDDSKSLIYTSTHSGWSAGWNIIDLSAEPIPEINGNFYAGLEWTVNYDPRPGVDMTLPISGKSYWTSTSSYIPFATATYDYLIRVMIEPAVIDVDIDIKPSSDPNSINLKSKGVIPVAILTTETFDATTVDPVTVEFAGAAPLRWAVDDVDDDGDMDLIFFFKTQEVGIMAGDTEAILTGATFGGESITGTDSIMTVPRSN